MLIRTSLDGSRELGVLDPAVSTSFKTARRPGRTMEAMNTPTTAPLDVPRHAVPPHASQLASPDAPLPGPRDRFWGFPLLGAMKRDYLGFTTGLQRQYGDLVAMRIAFDRSVDVFAPDAVREVLVDNAAKLVRWERGIEVFEGLLGRGVLVSEGAAWQRQRRMLQPAFTPRRVAAQAGLMVEAIAATFERELPAVPAGDSFEVAMDTLLSSLAMNVILRTMFSSSEARDTRGAIAATQLLSQVALREMFWPVTLPDWLPLPGKRAKRSAMRELRALVGGHIARRRAAIAAGEVTPRDDLLAALIDLRDTEGPEATGGGLSDREIFDQCVTAFQAGHETTATALLWWSRLIADHPQAAARAREEVDAVLGGREPTAADLPALPWLAATLKESMRLYPPVAALMTRRATADLVVQGRTIPRGTLLRITPWVLQRDPRNFAEPDAFRPERFLPDAPAPQRGASIAFGTGPRVCIGQHFALLEMTLASAMLLQRWTMTLPPATGPAEPDMNVTLRPRGGLRLRLQARKRIAAAPGERAVRDAGAGTCPHRPPGAGS
jgi:cytochrome P450